MKRPLYITGGCLLILLVLFFGFDPNKLPAFMLVIPFSVLFMILFLLLKLFFEKQGMGYKKSVKIAVLCAALPILLLVLQSIGQLTVRDVLTAALLFGLSYFYISRATASS